jgi:hypothetical protein
VAVKESLFIDATVATEADHNFLKALNMNMRVWTDTDLFQSLDYDTNEAKDHPYVEIFRFLDGVRSGEDRFRFDRVICAHLVLLATLNSFGYDYQETPKKAEGSRAQM